jgi:hypothetical protein
MSTARTKVMPGPASRSAPSGGAASRIALLVKAFRALAAASSLPVPTTAGRSARVAGRNTVVAVLSIRIAR